MDFADIPDTVYHVYALAVLAKDILVCVCLPGFDQQQFLHYTHYRIGYSTRHFDGSSEKDDSE